jgi:hypothetical protein
MSGLSALYIFGEVPRVRQDILVHIPVIGSYWERSVPPEDNVSILARSGRGTPLVCSLGSKET